MTADKVQEQQNITENDAIYAAYDTWRMSSPPDAISRGTFAAGYRAALASDEPIIARHHEALHRVTHQAPAESGDADATIRKDAEFLATFAHNAADYIHPDDRAGIVAIARRLRQPTASPALVEAAWEAVSLCGLEGSLDKLEATLTAAESATYEKPGMPKE